MSLNIRVGFGFDVHAFAEGRKLILGGIEIPFDKGLEGHSDADVLLHAICDAMLGALALGDIGTHFPDTDEKWKDADSKILLKRVNDLINSKGYQLGNLDCVLALQQPKISLYSEMIRNKIAEILNADVEQISLKASTTEKLGFVGRSEGVISYATVLLVKKDIND
ncbi:MAG TPA: 2-C-methyl-D-erythritol 2,4-cyclodiphosphate synthase [Ignavibacteriaceae bacterium]|jgi:2-C-methyl-D-erythritol 2,4-cyclodiphosphate synthase|nr:MAG: 2-C-methyl-D-erythritol 2,4-cyclodiphosphate synthase [Ignavibacteria bacterium ADurb.Bin266]OQY71972.1 MAG: 2-C-methyl-D-erythritol 2,4-cyclodiphosphate synthase [Ignavibacteriales bacterium UTCHB2]HQF41372.1 2-C-methyl-D-erythritol 2,4-cyclodiphosphate synthase [Ignavibacteriaceae bacterium]HQI41901.1 2-C-methyl-D-erythritol 2,4-cyclodiphosphate synthase [Ignavibacteriaceae bacterium]